MDDDLVPDGDVLLLMATAPPMVAEVVAMMAETGCRAEWAADWVAGTRWGEL